MLMLPVLQYKLQLSNWQKAGRESGEEAGMTHFW